MSGEAQWQLFHHPTLIQVQSKKEKKARALVITMKQFRTSLRYCVLRVALCVIALFGLGHCNDSVPTSTEETSDLPKSNPNEKFCCRLGSTVSSIPDDNKNYKPLSQKLGKKTTPFSAHLNFFKALKEYIPSLRSPELHKRRELSYTEFFQVQVIISSYYYPRGIAWSLNDGYTNDTLVSGTIEGTTTRLSYGLYWFELTYFVGDGLCCRNSLGTFSVEIEGATALKGGRFAGNTTGKLYFEIKSSNASNPNSSKRPLFTPPFTQPPRPSPQVAPTRLPTNTEPSRFPVLSPIDLPLVIVDFLLSPSTVQQVLDESKLQGMLEKFEKDLLLKSTAKHDDGNVTIDLDSVLSYTSSRRRGLVAIKGSWVGPLFSSPFSEILKNALAQWGIHYLYQIFQDNDMPADTITVQVAGEIVRPSEDEHNTQNGDESVGDQNQGSDLFPKTALIFGLFGLILTITIAIGLVVLRVLRRGHKNVRTAPVKNVPPPKVHAHDDTLITTSPEEPLPDPSITSAGWKTISTSFLIDCESVISGASLSSLEESLNLDYISNSTKNNAEDKNDGSGAGKNDQHENDAMATTQSMLKTCDENQNANTLCNQNQIKCVSNPNFWEESYSFKLRSEGCESKTKTNAHEHNVSES